MDAMTAARLIEQVSYKPRWFLNTSLTPDGQALVLYVDYEARNSNSELAPYYFSGVRNVLEFEFTTAELTTPIEVYRKVLNCLIECEKHEAEEFFKIGQTYDAPFHPHTDTGLVHLERTAQVAVPAAH